MTTDRTAPANSGVVKVAGSVQNSTAVLGLNLAQH